MNKTKKRTLLVCVEGPIGVGKSTLLDNLDALNKPGVVTLKEPVEDWKSVQVAEGKNMLQGMYDGTTSSALFQLSILQSRFGPLVRALTYKDTRIVVSERGPWSEKLVFAKSNLSTSEFACYQYAHSSLIKDLFPVVGEVAVLFLYLDLPTDAILERIKTRGREEEKDIKPEYLNRLAEAHVGMKSELPTPASLGCEDAILSPVRHVSVNAGIDPDALVSSVWEIIQGAAAKAFA
jgi:deoxyadenosine/deoxycytidine kinase